MTAQQQPEQLTIPEKAPAAGDLPQDPQEVRLRAGHLFGTPGVYVATSAGATFLPRHCIPDVQRRLAMLARKIEHLPTLRAPRASRKDHR